MIKTVKEFMDEDFLLENKIAKTLFHGYARDLPIIDYHNHLSPGQIADNFCFPNISAAWLHGDHYKWRAMRAMGIDECFVTGQASDFEKFKQWAAIVPYTIRNPLFHWTHLELKRYFGISKMLCKETAEEIYKEASIMLASPDYSTQNLLHKMNVELVCTTDDPTDSLEYHRTFSLQEASVQMLPAFRPDKAILIGHKGYRNYITTLAEMSDVDISDYDSLVKALEKRIEFFSSRGCKLADHGLEQVYSEDYTLSEINQIFQKKMGGAVLNRSEELKYMSSIMFDLCKMYAKRAWVQQFHLGALRSTNSYMLKKLGPDTGYDSIGDFPQARSLSKFLDRLENVNLLTKTILYNLNPADNAILATMIGNFNGGGVKGKMQFGSGWWYLDQKEGMEQQLNTLSNMGLLCNFVGMLTDSRSFLSFPRHEYFRRILCNLIGKDVHNGELPNDVPWLGKIISDISYHNALEYFDF